MALFLQQLLVVSELDIRMLPDTLQCHNGLTISYDGQAKDELRNRFEWIFFSEYRTIRVTLPLPLRKQKELAFSVHLPKYDKIRRKEDRNNVKRFMDGAVQEHEVNFGNLALRSQGTSFAPSESLSPTKRPVYVKRRELGKGAFGRVRKPAGQ